MSDSPSSTQPAPAAAAPRFKISDAALLVFMPDGRQAKPGVRLVVDREGYIGVIFTDPNAPVYGYTFWISTGAIEATRAGGRASDSLE